MYLHSNEHFGSFPKNSIIEQISPVPYWHFVKSRFHWFPFEGNLYGVGLRFNVEKQLETKNKTPAFYKRSVDDMLSAMPDVETASDSPSWRC